ncbi:sensor histidine kinase [Sphingomonas hankyongi]|uniref:histidine kinase n=1 Tax=Sphingomonas hankyongi TaxID=2908209 RepID=A0ABT0RY70_9SPHN|nr:HAMP domain-containing histidine kinase [Sphingomonas hankyongi]
MAQDQLGLFDTAPSRTEIRIAFAIGGLIGLILLVVMPFQNIHVGAIPGLIPALDAGMLVCDLITAAILYAQATVYRSRALVVLASGYVLAGLLLIPWALTFPGAFSPNGLLGAKINTTGWIAAFWRLSVPIAIFLYAWLKRADEASRPGLERFPTNILAGVLTSIALAIFVTLLATLGHDLLPPFFTDKSHVIRSTLVTLNLVVIGWTTAAAVMLVRQEKSVLDLWLLVSLAAWLAQSLLNMLLHSRFSLGAYVFLGLVLVSNLSVMLALITESNRLYARLAVSTAARRREREARLMSMDAVTAAISHEVGQPLTAVSLNAAAGLNWLTQPRPDVKKAIAALRAVGDAGSRTFDIIRSIRATFAKEPGRATEFCLNDLVLETTSLFEREMAASKISLKLSLADGLPPIKADRVQIQRVLVNLLNNAVESLRALPDRSHSLAISSAVANGRDVLIEVNDNGTGIADHDMEHIFDPFFTTKATGTGLGLPLCRTIAEEHGGQLWASSGNPEGATFHLKLPRSGASEGMDEADVLLTSLEGSLKLFRQSKPDGLTEAITELQHIVDEVRHSMRRPKS